MHRRLSKLAAISNIRFNTRGVYGNVTENVPLEPNILKINKLSTASPEQQATLLSKLLKDSGYNFTLLKRGVENIKAIHYSFDTLTSLYKAHSQTLRLGYVSIINRESVSKTFPYDDSNVESLPKAKPKTKIVFVNELAKVDSLCNLLEKEAQTDGYHALGLDCEWKPERIRGEVNPIDVIQLSSSKTTGVFHLSALQRGHKIMPPSLERILTNKNITKLVVDIPDIRRLHREYNIQVNHLDLQKMPISYRIGTKALSGMVEIFFKERLSKAQTNTNWSLPSLSKDQITYAALDAEYTRRLYFSIKDLPLD